VKRQPRLRRLVPDAELFRRRAGGEPVRALARDHGVSHATLSRYFARPEARRQLQQAGSLPLPSRRQAPVASADRVRRRPLAEARHA
jgi:hypothetical protein